jgi:hypothetical protein
MTGLTKYFYLFLINKKACAEHFRQAFLQLNFITAQTAEHFRQAFVQ